MSVRRRSFTAPRYYHRVTGSEIVTVVPRPTSLAIGLPETTIARCPVATRAWPVRGQAGLIWAAGVPPGEVSGMVAGAGKQAARTSHRTGAHQRRRRTQTSRKQEKWLLGVTRVA